MIKIKRERERERKDMGVEMCAPGGRHEERNVSAHSQKDCMRAISIQQNNPELQVPYLITD